MRLSAANDMATSSVHRKSRGSDGGMVRVESFRALALVLWPIAACRMQACWTSLAVVALLFVKDKLHDIFAEDAANFRLLHESMYIGSGAGVTGTKICSNSSVICG